MEMHQYICFAGVKSGVIIVCAIVTCL